MLYKNFNGLQLSRLGFGTMRLPVRTDGSIDENKTEEMFRYAVSKGVNYFDTACPYHNGKSETVTGRILRSLPKDSWFLADKYPGHQLSSSYNPAKTFEGQLEKCGVDRFDFYLFHNICENSLPVYGNPEWGILDYFVEQKKKGRIGHLGFSSHADLPALKSIMEGPYGEHVEFCQIQLNYLDWTLQKAREKYDYLTSLGIPVWVMEPVRGGLLANPGEENIAAMKALRPDASAASWGFRWLQSLPGVAVTLSGMSSFEQVEDNIRTYTEEKPLGAEESALLSKVAASLSTDVPCTACRYCCDACPQGLDIPLFIQSYKDIATQFGVTPIMRLEALDEALRPSACLGCGSCAKVCPQGIDIPGVIAELNAKVASGPSWVEICRERERIARGE